MAKVILEVAVDWSNGQQITNKDGSKYWTGAVPVIPTLNEDDEPGTDISFSGWVNLKAVEDGKLPVAQVYIWTSEEKLVKISKEKKGDGEFKFRIKNLKSDKARNKKDDLDPANCGD